MALRFALDFILPENLADFYGHIIDLALVELRLQGRNHLRDNRRLSQIWTLSKSPKIVLIDLSKLYRLILLECIFKLALAKRQKDTTTALLMIIPIKFNMNFVVVFIL